MGLKKTASAVGVAVLTTLGLGGCSTASDSAPEQATPVEGVESGSSLDLVPDLVDKLRPSVVTVITGSGEGSGVVWNDEGIVVTNHHVVSGHDRVTIALADGRRIPAEVIASDARSDLAVLRTPDDDLPPAEFATRLPEVGSLAVAIGNPLGFENTVTAGVVSGLQRNLPAGQPSLVDLVQTDAPISPGNSGGALVGADGKVIGINVAFIPPSANAVALGFAIPAPTVRHVVEQLLEEGSVRYAYLGVTPATVTPELAERLGTPARTGVAVITVADQSPAANGGLAAGDVIVEVDGDDVRSVEDLFALLRKAAPGDRLELTVVRDQERFTTDVTLGELPGEAE